MMRSEDVHYIAVEGGGAGGVLIHPGALKALESLQVVRQEAFKPAGVRAWSGSSSGSIISTLVSCGYASWEIAALANQEAFDMIFRLESIRQGEFAAIQGKCKGSAIVGVASDPVIGVIVGDAIRQSDPAGAVADLLHMSRLLISLYLENSQAVYEFFHTEQANRVNAIIRDSQKKGPGRFATLATEAIAEYGARMKKWPTPPSSVFALLDAEFPHVAPKLIRLISAHAAGKVKGPSIFQILKRDLGLSSGCVWRDYIDHLIAFARFRVRFAADLPSLQLPLVEDMKAVNELVELFHAAIERAITADYGTNEPPYDFFQEYNHRRYCTFAQHKAEFYDWLGATTVPPLIISGANISTAESHLFSALATPAFHVADAVRMATGLPPVFKPVVIEAADIPKSWPAKTDRFGTANYLQGLWVDGGLYYNAPFEVFKDASASFTGEQNTMGLGAGIWERSQMDNLTQFATEFINLGYAANVSATRIDLENFLNINTFEVGFAKPKVMPKALEYYRLDAYWRTFQFFGRDPGL
jgi:predicted acylesterase/phospholipase RssA